MPDPLADSMSVSQLWDHNWASHLIRLEGDERSQTGSGNGPGGNSNNSSAYSSAFSGKAGFAGPLSNAIRRGKTSDGNQDIAADPEKAAAEQNLKKHSSYDEYRALDGTSAGASGPGTESLTRGAALGWLRVRNKTVLPFDMVLKHAQKAFELAARPGQSGAGIPGAGPQQLTGVEDTSRSTEI